ncbi:MAG: hypothetical protein ACRCTG_15495 [Aestuariivirga sp.]
MPLLVSYARVTQLGCEAVGDILGYENIAAGSSTTARPAGEVGVVAICLNTETLPGRVAFGASPDATAAAKGNGTTAALAIAAGERVILALGGGDRINFVGAV